MGIFSNIEDNCSLVGQWIKNNPGTAVCLTLVSILAGAGAGCVAVATGAYGMSVAVGIAVGVGVAIKGSRDGVKAERMRVDNDKLRVSNNSLKIEEAKRILELATERATNKLNQTALQQNAQTLKNKNVEILKLQTSLLQKQANAPTLVNSVKTPDVSGVSTQSMFRDTPIRRRPIRNAANESVANHSHSALI